MDTPSINENYLQSLSRCEKSEGFMPTFYARLCSSSEAARAKFNSTNFEQLNEETLSSLRWLAGLNSDDPAELAELRERAAVHCRQQLNIQPEYTEFWKKALISTAADTDPEWDERIESAWQSTLHRIVNGMVEHYQ